MTDRFNCPQIFYMKHILFTSITKERKKKEKVFKTLTECLAELFIILFKLESKIYRFDIFYNKKMPLINFKHLFDIRVEKIISIII